MTVNPKIRAINAVFERGSVRVVQQAHGRWTPDRLADRAALETSDPSLRRDGLPVQYDGLLRIASSIGLSLESAA
jgi:hypothetical protein